LHGVNTRSLCAVEVGDLPSCRADDAHVGGSEASLALHLGRRERVDVSKSLNHGPALGDSSGESLLR
jgi:hypothetical protein